MIMSLTNTEFGKAYEYACLIALRNHISRQTIAAINIIDSNAYRTAQAAFQKAEKEHLSEKLVLAANAAARVILRLEPQLEHGTGSLYLMIQTDAQGVCGDVRDVVCVRRENGWEIGISCKHNHHAVKHSRLSATIDFGQEWFGIPCSQNYFDTVTPIFNELKDKRTSAIMHNQPIPLWNDVPDKINRYYIPILN